MEKINVSSIIVVRVIDSCKLVINKGILDGINEGQRFLIYAESDDAIKDPITNADLGKLEIVKGIGKVTHVQEKISTIETDECTKGVTKIVRQKNPLLSSLGYFETETHEPSGEKVPFDSPKVGDYAKPI